MVAEEGEVHTGEVEIAAAWLVERNHDVARIVIIGQFIRLLEQLVVNLLLLLGQLGVEVLPHIGLARQGCRGCGERKDRKNCQHERN